jgi:CheY-like chemotaxis protein
MGYVKPVLLVEDDRLDSMALSRALKELGVSNELMHARDGEEALMLLTDKRHEMPCLILLDLNMPRMNGLEFLEAIRSEDTLKRIPVVMVSTSEARQDLARSLELGAVAYVVKCPDYSEFRESMRVVKDYVTDARVLERTGGRV